MAPPTKDVLSQHSHGLLARLNLMIDTFLRDRPGVKQDSHLSLYLGAESMDATLQIDSPRFHAAKYLKRATTSLRHLNCPHCNESALIQRPLRKHVFNNQFITCLHSRWVHGYRFSADKTQIDAYLYILLVLHTLHPTPGIKPFVEGDP